jgi:RNA polymerase sigma factor (TIGR02999 family)
VATPGSARADPIPLNSRSHNHFRNVSAAANESVTRLIESVDHRGDGDMGRLVALVYDDLRAIAHRQLRGERPDHTLSTTALIHEAYLKLADQTRVPARGRAYFFGAAAIAMRQILVDHARRRGRRKRGGGQRPVTLEEEHLVADDFAAEVLDLHEALDRLAAIDARSARVVECRFFGGLSNEETADALDISPRTVRRDWLTARAWLFRALHGDESQ